MDVQSVPWATHFLLETNIPSLTGRLNDRSLVGRAKCNITPNPHCLGLRAPVIGAVARIDSCQRAVLDQLVEGGVDRVEQGVVATA